ncbi:MAG: 60S ribosomal export protein NMD3 [Halobacteriota archaeon]
MTRAKAFCPRCGAATDPDDFGDRPSTDRGLCRSCYLDEHQLVVVPETISIERCASCGSLHLDGEWTDRDDALVDVAVDVVADAVEVHRSVEELTWEVAPTRVDTSTVAVECRFDLRVEGAHVEREATASVSFEPTTCPRCSRIAGRSYASTVQLRATGRSPDDRELDRARSITADVLTDRVDLGDRDAFLTEVVERTEGLDLRLSTTRLGSQVATAIQRELGGTLETTSTLVTTDSDGQEVYRTTHAIRLPRLREGDILAVDDGAILVEGVGEQVRTLDLRTGERERFDVGELTQPVVAHRRDARSATIVDVPDEHAVQLIDPTTYETITVARYADVDVTGDTVESVRVDGVVHLLPGDG